MPKAPGIKSVALRCCAKLNQISPILSSQLDALPSYLNHIKPSNINHLNTKLPKVGQLPMKFIRRATLDRADRPTTSMQLSLKAQLKPKAQVISPLLAGVAVATALMIGPPPATPQVLLSEPAAADSLPRTAQFDAYAELFSSAEFAEIDGSANIIELEPSDLKATESKIIYLAPTSVVAPEFKAIDTYAVVELIALLDAFIPLAETHDLAVDAGLLSELQLQAERLGLALPISVQLPGGQTGFNLANIYLADDASALVANITGAAEAWTESLAATPAIERSAAASRNQHRFAPASRSAARAGIPADAAEVLTLVQAVDTWLADEAQAARDAEIQRIADLRARMVALSRQHGNGRLPTQTLCPIPWSPRFTMRCDVIPSLVELNAAFHAHFGRNLQVSSGYRAGGNGRSNHGWGLAIDFGGQMTRFGTAEFQWMDANARNFGWGHAFWARPGGINPEPWHWEAMDEVREMTGQWR